MCVSYRFSVVYKIFFNHKAINEKFRITSQQDVDELLEELKGKNLNEDILETHNTIRTPHGDEIISSKVQIISITNLYVYIVLREMQ